MHETLSAGFGRAKLIQTSEEDPNILRNVTPKAKLNSCLCSQTPCRRSEPSHLGCPGAAPLTARSQGGRRYQESPCSWICLCCCSLSHLGEKLSNLGSATDLWGHRGAPGPSVCFPASSRAINCHLLLPSAQTYSCVWLNLTLRRPRLKISFTVTTISVYSWMIQKPRKLWQ